MSPKYNTRIVGCYFDEWLQSGPSGAEDVYSCTVYLFHND